MNNNDKKRFYWLKLDKGFFKRHDIKIVESMDNGKDYILFYLKLLVEGITHEGQLRFSESVPYNESMLATITNTNVDIVRSAIKVFEGLGMMKILSDGTIYLEQCQKMLGCETLGAIRKREYREKERLEKELGQCPKLSQESPIEIELEKDKEIDKELELDIEKDKIKIDKNREKQNPIAYQLSLRLVRCHYIDENDPDLDDYISNLSEWIKKYELTNVKVKLDYFIKQVCSFMPNGTNDKSGKPVFEYIYRKDNNISDKYNYFVNTMFANLKKTI